MECYILMQWRQSAEHKTRFSTIYLDVNSWTLWVSPQSVNCTHNFSNHLSNIGYCWTQFQHTEAIFNRSNIFSSKLSSLTLNSIERETDRKLNNDKQIIIIGTIHWKEDETETVSQSQVIGHWYHFGSVVSVVGERALLKRPDDRSFSLHGIL